MIHRSKTLAGALLAATLVLAACGSDGDEPAATDAADEAEEAGDEGAGSESADEFTDSDETSGEEAGDDPPETESAGGETDSAVGEAASSDDDRTVIDDFGDIPGECIDLMADFLREIEPEVSEVDWETATLADLEPLDAAIEVPSDEFDERAAELGCDDLDIGANDEQSFEFVIRVAEREAPGTVGWLEFIFSLSGFADDVADAAGSGDGTGSASPGPDGDLPTDCEGIKDYLLAAANEYGSIESMPVSEAMNLTTVVPNLMSACSIDEALAFLEDPAIAAFIDG